VRWVLGVVGWRCVVGGSEVDDGWVWFAAFRCYYLFLCDFCSVCIFCFGPFLIIMATMAAAARTICIQCWHSTLDELLGKAGHLKQLEHAAVCDNGVDVDQFGPLQGQCDVCAKVCAAVHACPDCRGYFCSSHLSRTQHDCADLDDALELLAFDEVADALIEKQDFEVHVQKVQKHTELPQAHNTEAVVEVLPVEKLVEDGFQTKFVNL
jgi:hypothetical protein